MKFEKFLPLLRKLATYSDHWQHRIGTIIIKNRRIISTGFNKCKTHPLSPHPFRSCHSEFVAIHSTPNKEDLKGSTIYVARFHRDSSLAIAKPCPTCLELIKKFGIRRVIYSGNGTIEEMVLK